MLYADDIVSLRPVPVICMSADMIRNNPGNALVCPGLQAPMVCGVAPCYQSMHACMHMACGLNFQPLETVRGLGKCMQCSTCVYAVKPL